VVYEHGSNAIEVKPQKAAGIVPNRKHVARQPKAFLLCSSLLYRS
jgi:hypothetical protein